MLLIGGLDLMRECTKILIADLQKEVPRPGILKIIERAKQDYYHDFFGIPDLPEMELIKDLRAAGASHEIRQNVVDGKYDASKEDSDEWMASSEGIEIMKSFPKDMLNKMLPPGLRKPE